MEASKAFAKEFMARHGIPTAAYRAFDDFEGAEEYAKNCDLPVVVKADGLALGKGVVICRTRQEVFDALKSVMVDLKFGENAGRKVVMEEFMTGREVTVLAFCDGKTLLPMPASQDHKKRMTGTKAPTREVWERLRPRRISRSRTKMSFCKISRCLLSKVLKRRESFSRACFTSDS